MHVRTLFAFLIAVASGVPALAADEYRSQWKVEGWSGYDLFTNGRHFACDAVHDFGLHLSIRLERIAGRPASELILWDSNGEVDFATIADVGTSVTLALGGVQHSYKVKDSYSMILVIVPEPGIMELLAAGGPMSFKLPNGKTYSAKLPRAAAAMANYRKCLENNGLAIN